MPYAIRMHEAGGPEVLKWEEVEVADPGEGEIRLRQTAAGLNFADTKRRGDTTQTLDQPVIPGGEGAGVVQAVGAGVSEIKVGRRIAYVGVPGSYAEERVIPAAAAIPLPDGISDEIAAAMMLKGMTAHMLLFKSYLVAKGDTILVHAAAGGVGSILCQWAKHLGATVIGTVSSAEKAKLIVKLGCDHAINYASENFEERVKDITGGDGVAAVYDSIGKDTWEGSLNSLARFGVMVLYGSASGAAPDISPSALLGLGSISLTRPTQMHYLQLPGMRAKASGDLFDVVSAGHVKIDIGQSYALKDASQAHADMEARKTTGSTVLLA